MLRIDSYSDFMELSPTQRTDVLKSLGTKQRLFDYLESLNNRSVGKPHWKECNKCSARGYVYVQDRDNRGIHPSSVHGCIKKLWYFCTGQEKLMKENVGARLRMIFDLGHAWHDTLQRYGKDGAWGEGYMSEVAIDPDAEDESGNPYQPVAREWWIRGHVDAIIPEYEVQTKTLGKVSIKVVHEYKTINSSGYSKLSRPKEEHRWQATIYGAVFDAPVVVYLYTNKDNCQMVEFPVAFDETTWNRVQEKISVVKEYSQKGESPPWTLTSSIIKQGECLGCGFLEVCNPPHLKGKK